VDEDRKAEATFSFFNETLGVSAQRQHAICLDTLDLLHLNLDNLGEHFTKAEILAIIRSLPLDKAPGPDDFTPCVLQSCCDIIQLDLMASFDAF
jgi:hypothetical protein